MTTVPMTDQTFEEAYAWILAHPTKHQGGKWATDLDSWCEQLMNNSGGFGPDAYASAALAGSKSGKLDTDMTTAKVGEFVYWTNHVGLVIRPGVMICASQTFAGGPTGWGEMEIAKYATLHSTQHWRGHSFRHGGHILKVIPPTPDPIGDPHFKGAVLWTNDTLEAGDYLKAGNYSLVMQGDCHLVEYRTVDGIAKPVWSTNDNYKLSEPGLAFLLNQGDGNLVNYGISQSDKRFAIWATMTNQKAFAGSHVKLVDDGRLVIIQPSGAMKTILPARQ